MKGLIWIAVLVTGLMAVGSSHAQAEQVMNAYAFKPCLYAYDPSRGGEPRFQDFSAEVSTAKPKPPKIIGRDARLFRTMIRDGSAVGVNFAGHYTIVGWGCGSRCLDWAVIDRATGNVVFDPALRIVATDNVDDEAPTDPSLSADFRGLLFRRDSKLRIPTMPPPYSDLMLPPHSGMMPPPSEGVL